MRVTLLGLIIAATAGSAHAAMTPPGDIALDCGRIVYSGAAAATESAPSGTEFELARYRNTTPFVTYDAALSAIAARAVGSDSNVVIAHAHGSSRAELIEIGAPGAPCWDIEAETRGVYADAYAAQPTPHEPKRTRVRIQRLRRLR